MHYFSTPADDIPPDLARHIIAWARVPPAKAWKHPGAPRDWTPVLAVDPSEPSRAPMAGYFWLYQGGRVREVHALPYEVVEGQQRPG